jgi:hypothetical protein
MQYSYFFQSLAGNGTLFIPILDPSGILLSSLPSNVTLIDDNSIISADWPGPGNLIPSGESLFGEPAALLEVPEEGASSLSFSFLDRDPAVNGPILADNTLLDPMIPGPPNASVPGPIAGAGLPGLVFAGGGMLLNWWRKKRRSQKAVA